MKRLLLPLLALAACGAPASPTFTRGALDREPIVHGSTETSSAYEVVGMIFVHKAGETSGFLCTATLIAPNVALTAGHCTTDDQNHPLDFSSGAYVGHFYLGVDVFNAYDARFPIRNLVTYPGYTGPPNFKNDMGLAVLGRDAAADGYTPFPFATSHVAELDTGGVSAHFVGYGITATNADDPGIRRSVDIPIHGTSNPSSACSAVGYDPVAQFCDGDGVHSTCSGDSGGPAILPLGGTPTIVGVTSYGSAQSCLTYGVDTRIDHYTSWLQATVAATPAGESCTNSVDDDGDGLIDCLDPDCFDSPTCQTNGSGPRGECETCSGSASCATGLICVKPLHSATSGICHAPCGGSAPACSGAQVCAAYSTGEQACSCGVVVGAEGDSCFVDHPCGVGLVCSAGGQCRAPCGGSNPACPGDRQCNGTTCEPIPPKPSTTGTAGSTSSGGGDAKSGGCATTGATGSFAALLGLALLGRKRR